MFGEFPSRARFIGIGLILGSLVILRVARHGLAAIASLDPTSVIQVSVFELTYACGVSSMELRQGSPAKGTERLTVARQRPCHGEATL